MDNYVASEALFRLNNISVGVTREHPLHVPFQNIAVFTRNSLDFLVIRDSYFKVLFDSETTLNLTLWSKYIFCIHLTTISWPIFKIDFYRCKCFKDLIWPQEWDQFMINKVTLWQDSAFFLSFYSSSIDVQHPCWGDRPYVQESGARSAPWMLPNFNNFYHLTNQYQQDVLLFQFTRKFIMSASHSILQPALCNNSSSIAQKS